MPLEEPLSTLVGGNVLSLVTAGMYDDPLAIYREYIQNAADAVSRSNRSGRVDITIDPVARRIRIRDNGPGLSRAEATRSLVVVADSDKTHGVDRGFRGIGRLSGLACAEFVVFRTRCRSRKRITRVEWDGVVMRTKLLDRATLEDTIRSCVSVSSEDAGDYPEHFFEVEILGVSRHVSGRLLNSDAVKDYVSEVCPVPISDDFPLADEVTGYLHGHILGPPLDIHVNGAEEALRRLRHPAIAFSDVHHEAFAELETFQVPDAEGRGLSAIGWLAHSAYLGAIPKNLRLRGIRARCGNIQVGSDTVFDHLFREERFNRWCVGEVHVIDPRILPNGHRTYFESGPRIRNLENHLSAIAHQVSSRCRRHSSIRHRQRQMASKLERAENALEAAVKLIGSEPSARDYAWRVLGAEAEALRRLRADTPVSQIDCPETLNSLSTLEATLSTRTKQLKPSFTRHIGIRNPGDDRWRVAFERLASACGSPTLALTAIQHAFLDTGC